jgi:hypothetical protein
MSHDRRRWLIQSLRKHLIPAFEERGFEVVPLAEAEARSPEFRRAFPFGQLRRNSPRSVDLVEIQLDKRGDAAFRLNIGIAPHGGVNHFLGHVAEKDVRVHYLSRSFEAYSCPQFRRWFRVRRWFGPPATEADYESLVLDNIDLVQEVEDVLREEKRGPHIRLVEI